MDSYVPWILSGLGLALFLEGCPYFLFPARMRKRLLQLGELSRNTLRWSGFAEAAIGIFLVWLSLRLRG